MTRSTARGLPRPGSRRGRTPFRIRPAGASDADLLVRHRQGMWRDIRAFRPAELARAGPRYRWWMHRERTAHRFFAFVAETRAGDVAGSGAVWLQPSQPRPGRLSRLETPYIMSMYTEPAFRRQGVGSSLVRHMLAWARRRGFVRVTLHASEFGRPVYERIGFEDSNEMRFNLRSLGPGRPVSQERRRPGGR